MVAMNDPTHAPEYIDDLDLYLGKLRVEWLSQVNGCVYCKDPEDHSKGWYLEFADILILVTIGGIEPREIVDWGMRAMEGQIR